MTDSAVPVRVVLVDDDAKLVSMMAHLLEAYGHRVVGRAGDGTEVLDTIARARSVHGDVDVLVMDQRMPGMNGLEATRKVLEHYPGLPVILHTAQAGLLGDEPRRAGVWRELCKGVHPRTFVTTVESARRH